MNDFLYYFGRACNFCNFYREYMRFVKPSSSPKDYGLFLQTRRKKKKESRLFMKKNLNEKTLKKIYERSKSGMLKNFGRVLSYDEFVSVLAYAHDHKMV